MDATPADVDAQEGLQPSSSFFTVALRPLTSSRSVSAEAQPLLDHGAAPHRLESEGRDLKSADDAEGDGGEGGGVCGAGMTKGVSWISMLRREFGGNLLIALVIVQHLTKGFAGAWIGNAINFYFRDVGGVNSSKIQTYTAVIMTPWCLKGMLGLISDTVTICGYHKAPWITMSTIGCVWTALVVGLSPPKGIAPVTALACLLVMQLHIAWSDLLTEAKYSERIRVKPKHGTDLISFVWGGLSVFQLLAVASVGLLIEYLGARYVFALSSIPCALGLLPGTMNLLEEIPSPGRWININMDKVWKHSNYIILVLILTVMSILLAIIGVISENTELNCLLAVFAGVVTFVSFFIFADPLVAKTNAFFLLCSTCYLSIEGATFYFFTDNDEQYPDGPHFSAAFYTTGIGLVASATSILGIYLYNRCFSHWKYRMIFLVNGVVWTIINLISCAVFLRWNRMVGIPDEFFVLGSQALQEMILQMAWIPGVVLMSHLCHQGMEATMYALMAGSQNLGSNISYFTGAYLLQLLEVQPSGSKEESRQFDNLWLVAVISSLAGLVPLVFLPWLIPDARPDEKLVKPSLPHDALDLVDATK
mmetsp:Transcript_24136/g.47298  ORF Transcript_24136/g.47298 Transcript_24136/m.47298 type:complete len:591 (+) Transcript_24136:70-1842(+)